MKTKSLLSITFLVASLSGFSQVKSDRPAADFNGVKAGGTLRVNITQGETNSISVEGPSTESIDKVTTEIHDGILELSSKAKTEADHQVKVNITSHSLRSIEADGASDIRSTAPFKADQISIRCTGAGNVKFEADTKEMTADLSGAGKVVLTGHTGLLTATVSGAGTLKAKELESGKVIVNTSGAGNARVNPTRSLQAKASGAGNIIYQEEPAEKSVEHNGAGTIRKAHSKTGESNSGGDTTRLKIGHKKVMILKDDTEETAEEKEEKSNDNFKHWNGFDVGSNILVNAGGTVKLSPAADYMTLDYGKSISFAINLFEKDIHLYKNYINLVTGLGFEFDHFALQHNVSLRHDSSFTTAVNSSPINYRKNNLNENLLTVPLMFEFNTSSNPSKAFHIAVGMLGGWKIGAKTRQKYVDTDGKMVHNVFSNDYNLNPFRYSLNTRIGYGRFTIYASYALSEFFKPGRGPVLYPVTAGLHISI